MRWFNGPHQNRVFFLLKSRRIWLYAVFFLPFEYFFTALIDDPNHAIARRAVLSRRGSPEPNALGEACFRPASPEGSRAWAWTKGRRLPAPAPPAKKKRKEKGPKKPLRYHHGATTPFRRRGHPAATAASRDCAASRGAARPPDVAALSVRFPPVLRSPPRSRS